jgi:hypothetical protein
MPTKTITVPATLNTGRLKIFMRLCIFLLALSHQSAFSEEPIDTDSLLFSLPGKGLDLFKKQDFNDAAIIWLNESAQMMLSDSQNTREKAGILQVMATIAFEKAGNIEAYATWSDAIRYFLEASTNWDHTQVILTRDLNAIDEGLPQVDTSNYDAPIIAPAKDLLWLDIDSELGLSNYLGPAPGLNPSTNNEDAGIEDEEARYIPKPFAEIADEQQESAPKTGVLIQRGLPTDDGQ